MHSEINSVPRIFQIRILQGGNLSPQIDTLLSFANLSFRVLYFIANNKVLMRNPG